MLIHALKHQTPRSNLTHHITDSFGFDAVSYLAILEEGIIRSFQLFKIRLYETI
jgi:hypothetical protein